MDKKITIILISIFLILSCSNKNSKVKSGFEIIEKIKLDEPIEFTTLNKVANNFFGYNMRNNSLILLSKKGEILDKYKKIGKGPGEYIDRSELLVLGQYDRRWHVLDSNQQKVLLFKIEENQIIFDEEFKFDKPVSLGAISKNGKMYMNSFMGESLILKYSSDFELEDEFLPKEKKDMGNMSSEQMKDYVVNNLFLPVINEEKLILVGVFNKKLKFCSIKNDKLKIQKDTIIEHFKDEAFNYETKSSSDRRSMTINNIGYAGANIIRDKFVIAISQPKADGSYLHRYNLDGKYIDSILIENNPDEKIENIFGFKNGNFYFVKSVRNKTEENKYNYKPESNYLYRAKLDV